LATRSIIIPEAQWLSLVWQDAEIWSQLNTFFFAASLALFDRQLGRGLIFHRWILFTWLIIFFGSFFHPVV
jgi:hypothetical protein